ncbi:hypothetical protein Bca101_023234 [Brassica carinata]
MAIDFSQLPPPTSNFPARKKETNQASQNEARRKDLSYKTKEIKFRKRDKRIILQNENGPCNVLLLRNDVNLHPDRFQVSQERLLSLVAGILFDSDDDEFTENQQQKIADAINLLPSFADGINVDIKFRRIDDFECTPELAIFELLKIPLYHGWIVDPQDFETAIAIGCKSYNDLMTALVTLETETLKALIGQSSKKTRSFAVSTPASSAEDSKLGRGDIEEERVLLQALRLSEGDTLGFDTRRDSSSGGDSVYGYSDAYLMSEDDSLVDSMGAQSPCTSTPGSVTLEKANLESTKNDSSCEIQFKSEATNFADPDLTGVSQDDDNLALYEAEKSVTLGSPVYKGKPPLGKSSSEGKGTKGLTPREGELIKNFLNNNASQLTFPGCVIALLFFLEQGLDEGELCVFFRNNHFYTMLKVVTLICKAYDNELYNLVTDQGYLNERDLVWEKLNEVNGDSVFVNADFKVFKCESDNWDQQNALSKTADYIYSINSSASKQGMEVDPDLKMAMELQEQELGEDIGFEVL